MYKKFGSKSEAENFIKNNSGSSRFTTQPEQHLLIPLQYKSASSKRQYSSSSNSDDDDVAIVNHKKPKNNQTVSIIKKFYDFLDNQLKFLHVN